MKLSTQEITSLLGPAMPRQAMAPRELLRLLAASAPKFWAHCVAAGPTKADRRRKFLDLLDWFAQHHDASVRRRHPASYRSREGSEVRGSVDAVLVPRAGGAGVAVELDFSADITSAYKLLALRKQYGHGCLLVSAYGAGAAEVRQRVDSGFRAPTLSWLALVHVA